MPWRSRRRALSLRRLPLLSALLFVLCLMVSSAAAQIKTDDLPNLSTAESVGGPTSTSKDANTKPTDDATTTQGSDSSSTTEPPTTVLGKTTAPGVSGAAFSITEAPSIAGVGIPTMQVPNTNKAPFMQKSNLPEGTVFICVGAALAFLGGAVLAWRGMVAWSLHRSVKRAASAYETDSKPSLRSHDHRYSHAPSYGSGRPNRLRGGNGSSTRLPSTVPRNSSMLSIDQLAGNSGPVKPGSRGGYGASGTTSSAAARSTLYFSPTASTTSAPGHAPTASTGGASFMSPANRSSGYLPAGFYAGGSSQPAGGASSTHLAGGGAGYSSLSNLGPNNGSQPRLGATGGYASRSVSGVTPPASPGLPPSRGAESTLGGASSSIMGNTGARASTPALYDVSTSSLNLSFGQHGRAPSAYLEDLFENHGNGPRERY